MYTLGAPFDDTAVESGTNILVTGPPLVGKRRLALETLSVGTRDGEGTIIVSTRDSATRVRADLGELVTDRLLSTVGIVDAVTEHIGQTTSDTMTKYTSSPRDMSAIGIKFSEFIQSFYTDQQREHNRISLDSVTTLLLYSNLQTVFRFLHVFTSRVENVDGLGLYTIESTAHDQETMNTLEQLFDARIDVDESGAATLTLPDGATQRATL
jgi:KaiC/GvpD/RAD55 family RecA-like ATPase